METTWIRHPNLPGQETEVPTSSVGHYAHSGWEVMDSPPEWVPVPPEKAALERLENSARESAGMPEALQRIESKAADELQRTASKASGTEPVPDDTEDKPTKVRTRRVPAKEDDQ